MIKKLMPWVFGFLFSWNPITNKQANSDVSYEMFYKTLSEIYGKKGERISYVNYSSVPWERLGSEEIKIKNLEKMLDEPNISDKSAFEKAVFLEAAKQGYSKKSLENLNPKEAVDLAIKIVAGKYQFCYVDTDTSFIKQYGANLSNEKYFHLGFGDCNNYGDSFMDVFNIFKKLNKNLINAYATERWDTSHLWNQLVFLTKDSLYLSDLDITFFDKGSDLETKHFDFQAEAKAQKISFEVDPFISYYLNKEIFDKLPDSMQLKSHLKSELKSLKKIIKYTIKEEEIIEKIKENLTNRMECIKEYFGYFEEGFENKRKILEEINLLKNEYGSLDNEYYLIEIKKEEESKKFPPTILKSIGRAIETGGQNSIKSIIEESYKKINEEYEKKRRNSLVNMLLASYSVDDGFISADIKNYAGFYKKDECD